MVEPTQPPEEIMTALRRLVEETPEGKVSALTHWGRTFGVLMSKDTWNATVHAHNKLADDKEELEEKFDLAKSWKEFLPTLRSATVPDEDLTESVKNFQGASVGPTLPPGAEDEFTDGQSWAMGDNWPPEEEDKDDFSYINEFIKVAADSFKSPAQIGATFLNYKEEILEELAELRGGLVSDEQLNKLTYGVTITAQELEELKSLRKKRETNEKWKGASCDTVLVDEASDFRGFRPSGESVGAAKIGQSQVEDMHRRISNQRQQLELLNKQVVEEKENVTYWQDLAHYWAVLAQ